ncbi:MAG: glycosyltransferase [Bacteroidota bacterium]
MSLVILLGIVSSAFQTWTLITNHCALKKFDTPPTQVNLPSVTIVLAVYNEAPHLSRCLAGLLDQDYPNYKIVICNDGSQDGTADILMAFSADPRVEILQKDHQGKKAALTSAIEHSDSAWIVATDADCTPVSNSWLRSIMRGHESSDIVLGYGPYERGNQLVHLTQHFETWLIAQQYLSAAKRRRPYMAVGRNLAFRREVFWTLGGYESHKHLSSGDDDLLIASAIGRYRITTQIDPLSWTVSAPTASWQAYWKQKQRHLTTSSRYRRRTQLWLMVIYLTHAFSYVIPVSLLMWGVYMPLVLILLRWTVLIAILRRSPLFRWKKDDWWLVPVVDTLVLCFHSLHGARLILPKK